MTSSNTYAFSPSLADLVVNSFARIQIKRPALTVDHLRDATIECNLLFAEFSNRQPNLWTTETTSIPLIASTASYTLAAKTIDVLTAYIETGSGVNTIGRVVGPMSATDYASMPNKQKTGVPTSYWFNRQITPTITFYPVPSASSTYTAKLLIVRQIQDAGLASGETPDLPYRFLDALTAGLAYRLARIYAPSLEQLRKGDAMEAWQNAFGNDVDDMPLMLAPQLSNYFR